MSWLLSNYGSNLVKTVCTFASTVKTPPGLYLYEIETNDFTCVEYLIQEKISWNNQVYGAK